MLHAWGNCSQGAVWLRMAVELSDCFQLLRGMT